jgi:NADH:ubiquinone oxidoreductase subunit C
VVSCNRFHAVSESAAKAHVDSAIAFLKRERFDHYLNLQKADLYEMEDWNDLSWFYQLVGAASKLQEDARHANFKLGIESAAKVLKKQAITYRKNRKWWDLTSYRRELFENNASKASG